jgi:hypothetical protein
MLHLFIDSQQFLSGCVVRAYRLADGCSREFFAQERDSGGKRRQGVRILKRTFLVSAVVMCLGLTGCR